MNEFEEQSITTLRTLFGKVHILQQITIQDMLKPETYQLYAECLQEAYDALVQVEDALTTIGMKLEYNHWRLGGAVDELKPFMDQSRSKAAMDLEFFENEMNEID